MSNANVCLSCFKNCSSCVNSKINDCIKPKNGFYYDEEKKEILKCSDENCSSCHTAEECHSCKEGFFAEKKVEDGKQLVECKDCNIDKCLYCSS